MRHGMDGYIQYSPCHVYIVGESIPVSLATKIRHVFVRVCMVYGVRYLSFLKLLLIFISNSFL